MKIPDQSAILRLKTRLNPALSYSLYDADAKTNIRVKGNEFELILLPGQNSAIYFITENPVNSF